MNRSYASPPMGLPVTKIRGAAAAAPRGRTLLLAMAAFAVISLPRPALAQSYTLNVLHHFDGTNSQFPTTLAIDGLGNLYGIALRGGVPDYTNNGIVYQFSPGGAMTTLASFDGLDGDSPAGNLLIDPDGNLWGTTHRGGVDWHPEINHFGWGTVYRITASGVFTPGIVEFNGPHGVNPIGGLVGDASGNLFGITYQGGDPWDPSLGNFGTGTLFRLTPSAAVSNPTLFNGGNGSYPESGAAMDPQGNLYGTTSAGGAFGLGTLYKLSSTGVITTLYDFDRLHGKHPSSRLSIDSLGNLYGTTHEGGVTAINGGINGYGTIWKYSPTGGLKTLASFNGANGMFPFDGVTLDGQGNLFGVTSNGGASGNGVVYEYSATGILSILANFDGAGNGSIPHSELVMDGAGSLYGVANLGGASGHGTLFAVRPVTSSPVSIASVSLSPTSLLGGGTSQGNLTLSAPAPAGGVTVILGSGDSRVTPQGPLTIPAGASSATFAISTQEVPSRSPVVIQARLGGSAQQATLTVQPPATASLAVIQVDPDVIVGGTSSTGTVTLNRIAPAGGAVVKLASDNAMASVPATVTVVAGATAASFPITTQPVTSSVSVTITATLGTSSLQYFPLITPPLPYSVAGISVNLPVVQGGTPLVGRVMLSRPAQPGGLTVTLSSSSPAAIVPASVTVPESVGIWGFPIQTTSVSAAVNATITAKLAGTSASAPVSILAPAAPLMTGFTLTPANVAGGLSSQGTITLNTVAPAGGSVITLSKSSTVAGMPAQIAVPEGESTVSFAVTTRPVNVNTTASVTATLGGSTKSAALTVGPAAPPPTVSTLTLSPTSVQGGSTATGAVTLSGAAPSAGVTVTLSSSAPAKAAVPQSITIPTGANTASFTITTSAVTANTSVTISASTGGVTKSAVLTVTSGPPPPADTVAIQKAEYTVSKQQLLVEATSTSATATLRVYVSSTGALIGTLANRGGGKYAGQFNWTVNPKTILVKSSLGGSATKAVTPK